MYGHFRRPLLGVGAYNSHVSFMVGSHSRRLTVLAAFYVERILTFFFFLAFNPMILVLIANWKKPLESCGRVSLVYTCVGGVILTELTNAGRPS